MFRTGLVTRGASRPLRSMCTDPRHTKNGAIVKVLGTLLASLLVLFPSTAHAGSLQAGIAKVQETGNPKGRAVVLIPGLGCGPWIWAAQVKALSPKYHLFLVTLPGFDGMPFKSEDDLT